MAICCEFGRHPPPSVGRMPRRKKCRRSDYNVLLLGPPGAGTSMLARRLTTILPAMTLAEAMETTRMHRVAGLTGDRTALVTTRPCRAPHQTISDAGLMGGGHVLMPG
jgi:magnesium chelatase family protein